MYAVIFKAQIKHLDDSYFEMAKRMRTLAREKYNCVDFVSSSEDNLEIAISYWNSEDDINAWSQDPQHQLAQQLGRDRWYESYQVEVVKLIRKYAST